MYYEDSATHIHIYNDVTSSPIIFLVYFKPKTGKLNDVLVEDLRRTRFDIVLRTIRAIHVFGGRLIKDVVSIVYIDADKRLTLMLRSEDIPLNYFMDEQSLARSIRKIITSKRSIFEDIGYEDVIEFFANRGYEIVYLTEKGTILHCLPCRRTLFILGSNIDAPEPRVKHKRMSIGPLPYLASHVASFLMWLYFNSVYCRR